MNTPSSHTSTMFNPLPTSGIERIDALLHVVAQTFPTDHRHALELAREALHLSTELSYTAGKAEALWHIGKSENITAQPTNALEHYSKALSLFEELHNKHGILKVLNSIANIHSKLAHYTESDTTYQKALALSEELQDVHTHQTILHNIALTHEKRGNYAHAIAYIHQKLHLTRQHQMEIGTASALHLLGEMMCSLGNYPAALEHLIEAASRSRPFETAPVYSFCLASIGLVYIQLGKFTTALQYMMQFLHKAELENNPMRQAKAMCDIGRIYNHLGSTSTALSYYLKSLHICEEINNKFGEAEILRDLAEILLQLGNTHEALDYALKALDIAQSIEYKELFVVAQHTVGRVYKELHDYPNALRHLCIGLETAVQVELWEQELHLHNTLAITYKKINATQNSRHHARSYKQLAQKHFNEEEQKRALSMIQEFEEQKIQHELEQLEMSASRHVLPNNLLITANQHEFENMAKPAPPAERAVAPDITVSTFGKFAVVINGRELTPDSWQRKKARDIFKILLINYKKAVSTDEIIEHLWTDTAGKNILPTIWNSISYIRKALEPGIKPQSASSYIAVVDKTYILNLGDEANIDFLRFKYCIAEAHRTTNLSDRLTYLEKAVNLYTGDFLHEDLYEAWSCFERESLKNMYIESLTELANAYAAQKNNDLAVAFARKILETDRTYEEAYEIIFTVLASNEQKAELQKMMKQCREAFQKELACAPPAYLENMATM